MRVAIIGAGPAGLTAAMQLSRGGATAHVFEANDCIGGLARSFNLWGHRVDLGPHRFFSTDRRVNQLWLDVVGQDYAMVDRLTRIYHNHRFLHYPLKPLNVLQNLGPFESLLCLASYLKQRVAPDRVAEGAESFESWTVRRFGRRLFERFFKSYSEKLWEIPCQELSADFAAQRIKRLSLGEAVKNAFASRNGRGHPTLLDRFPYPLGGTGSVYEKMAERVRANGGEVRLERPVRHIVHEGFDVRAVELANGSSETFDHVISTMPLTDLVRGLEDVPADVQASADALQFRNTLFVYLHVDSDHLFDDQWLYIHDPELRMGRVTNFRNWASELNGDTNTTVLTVEHWCNDGDSLWTAPDQQLIDQAVGELRSAGLLRKEPVLDGRVIRAPRCYPVYRRGYGDHVAKLAHYLSQFRNLTAIGRYGAFKYNNQDHSILMGILAAENLLDGAGHDLWHVNTDHDTYQEAERIIDTCFATAPDSTVPEPALAER